MIVAKFGGSSLADATQFRKVKAIIENDSRRQIIVPSAPGKRFEDDDKVTDLLYRCHREHQAGEPYENTFETICGRYLEIARDLHLSIDMVPYLDEIRRKISEGTSADYCASRGEYLNGLLLADYLGFHFIDAAEVILFDIKGILDSERTNLLLHERLKSMPDAVIPGFYGSSPDGQIRVFSRGGSDITGALAARAAQAELYENWTDVSGFLMADPRIVHDPSPIRHITYHEMHELSCAGATVLHEDSVFPVSRAGIPTNVRNTNMPDHPGTMITCTAVNRENFSIFAGVAGKKGFSLLFAEKEVDGYSQAFAQGMLQAVQISGLHFQYLPLSASTICLMVNTLKFEEVQDVLKREISKLGIPYSLTVQHGFAHIVLVGYGIVHNRATVNNIYEAMKKRDIPIAVINQGSGELSTWVCVAENKMEEAIRCLHEQFKS
ncbi:MAG: aspartate kinase [Clostridiaceae bacterium]|nr:aspartate kinase [Clostridiaceae bacterium]